MWFLKILAYFAVFGTLSLFALLIIMCLYIDKLHPLYQLLRGRVFCRHCGKKIRLISYYCHPCVAVPECPCCGTYLTPHQHTCPNDDCSANVSEHLATIFSGGGQPTRKQFTKRSPQPLTDDEMQMLYPKLCDRMGRGR